MQAGQMWFLPPPVYPDTVLKRSPDPPVNLACSPKLPVYLYVRGLHSIQERRDDQTECYLGPSSQPDQSAHLSASSHARHPPLSSSLHVCSWSPFSLHTHGCTQPPSQSTARGPKTQPMQLYHEAILRVRVDILRIKPACAVPRVHLLLGIRITFIDLRTHRRARVSPLKLRDSVLVEHVVCVEVGVLHAMHLRQPRAIFNNQARLGLRSCIQFRSWTHSHR